MDDVRRSQSHTAPPQYKPSDSTSMHTLFSILPNFKISSFSNNYLARVNHKNQTDLEQTAIPHESVAAQSWRRDVASSGGGRGCPCPAITRKQPSLLGQHSYIGTTPTLHLLLSVGTCAHPARNACVLSDTRRDGVHGHGCERTHALHVFPPFPSWHLHPLALGTAVLWTCISAGDACGWLYEF